MKNPMLSFSLLCLFMCMSSFTASQQDEIIVLEKSFKIEKLQKYLEKDEAGKALPLTVVTNDSFSEYLDLDFAGQKMNLYKSTKESELKENEAYIDIRKFKIRNKVSILKFRYNGNKIKIKLRYQDGEWIYQSITVRGESGYYKHSEIEF